MIDKFFRRHRVCDGDGAAAKRTILPGLAWQYCSFCRLNGESRVPMMNVMIKK